MVNEKYVVILNNQELQTLIWKVENSEGYQFSAEDTETIDPNTKEYTLDTTIGIPNIWSLGLIRNNKVDFYVLNLTNLHFTLISKLYDLLGEKVETRIYHNVLFDLRCWRNKLKRNFTKPEWKWNYGDSMCLSRLALPIDCRNAGLLDVIKYMYHDLNQKNIDMKGTEQKKVYKTNAIKKSFLSGVSDEDVYLYAYYDAYYVWKIIELSMDSMNLNEKEIFNQENKVIPIWFEMSSIEWNFDMELLKKQHQEMEIRLKELTIEFKKVIGQDLNPTQTIALIPILEEMYGIKCEKTSKGKQVKKSIDISTLTKYKDLEAFKILMEYRTIKKLHSTYIKKYLTPLLAGKKIYNDGIKPYGPITGRISSTMQQWPSKSNYKNFEPRRLVIPRKGYEFWFIDIDQQELRFLDETSYRVCKKPDPLFSKAFRNINNEEDWKPIDPHGVNVSKIFHIIKEEDPELFNKYRKTTKIINFSIIYGSSLWGLKKRYSEDFHTDLTKVFNEFKTSFPIINNFFEIVKKTLPNMNGVYIQTNVFGRRIKTVNQKNLYLFVNYLIQGACAYWLKRKLPKIYEFCNKFGVTIINQVHDELVFEAPKGTDKRVFRGIRNYLNDNSEFTTPIESSVEFSDKNWADKKPVNF